MRTSDLRSRTSGGRAAPLEPPHSNRAAGFTLLELLVVVALVGILTGTVLLTITGADSQQRLKGTAEQLAYRMELARQYALQRNREWGVYLDGESVRFAEFDPAQSEWVEQTGRPFAETELMDNVRTRVETEGFEQLPEADRERLPQILLFSSGEVTPFEIVLEPEWDGQTWLVGSDGLSPVRAEPADA